MRVSALETRSASSRGFRFLASYIFGGNAGAQSIAMTSPVVLTRPPSGGGEAQHTVSFILPSKLALAELPPPNDPRVELTQHEASLRAVRRLGLSLQRFDEAHLARELAALEAEAAAAGLTWDPRSVHRTVMAYDPPWTPFFIARTEVALFPVTER